MEKPISDPRRSLYEAYCAVPEHLSAEIINGTLYVLPRPAPRHANAKSAIGAELFGPFQRGRGGPGGWWILDEPELHLVELEPMVPDLAGWRVERMPTLPETSFFTLAPDWICEVRSVQLMVSRTSGWSIRSRWLEVHTLGNGQKWREVRLYQGDAHFRAEPFAAIELDLSALWSPPRVG